MAHSYFHVHVHVLYTYMYVHRAIVQITSGVSKAKCDLAHEGNAKSTNAYTCE